MKKHAILATILFVSLTLCLLSTYVKAQDEAIIWTDKADYSPEETVTIFGTGFLPESHVTVEVTRPDSTVDGWNVISDLDGSFTTTYLLDGITGTYLATATDGTNTATTTFTDAELVSTEVVSGTDNAIIVVEQGQTVSFTIKISAPTGKLDASYTTTNPATGKIPTVYSVGSGGSTSATTLSSAYAFWSNPNPTPASEYRDARWTGYPTPYSVTASASASSDAPTGDYVITIVPTLSNPGGAPKLVNDVSDTLTIRVVPPPDTTPPDTSITAGPTGWIKVQSATFGWTGSDDVTAVANLVYSWRLDGGSWSGYSSATSTSLSGLTEGSHTFYAKAKDEAGNVDPTPATQSFSVDITAPVVTITAPASGAYYKSVNVPAGAYSVVEANPYTVVEVGPSTAEGAGSYTVTATDAAGNIGSDSVTYTVDNTPPVTTKTPTGTAGSNGWHVSDVNVALSATDNGGSGVKEIHYKLDGVETTVSGSSASFTISTDGSHSLEHWAVDNAGNEETHSTQTIKIDTTPPMVTLVTTRVPDSNGWYNHAVGFSLTATDATSGVASTVVPPDYSGPDSSSVTVTGSATDEAGNTGSTSVTFKYDATPPTVTLTPDRSADYNGWYNYAISWTVGASDATSGVASRDADFTYNGPDSSAASVSASATDEAGNTGSVTVNFNYDATPPSISGAATTSPNANGWYKTDVTVHFTASDGLSGIDTVTPDTTLTSEGQNQHVLGTAVDKAGNSATYDVTGINIDKTAPTITGSRSPAANSWGWNNVDVTVSFDTFDALSGIDPATDPADVTLSGEGAGQSVTGTVYDKAGNSASATVSDINIDKTAPIISVNLADCGVYPRGTELTFGATDSTSGVGTTTGSLTNSSGTYPISSPHVPSTSVYTLSVTATDKAGNVASCEVFFVIYDPNGGFVTGGGWIDSPIGAYTANPELTGKATFGFVSKYQKGATVPTGNTEFIFHVAGMNFKSTSYDWLVVSGAKAQFKGTGTINGSGEYKFILTAIDGGKTGVDQFRIKIWYTDESGEDHVVYDNKMGKADYGSDATTISSGSIVIHK